MRFRICYYHQIDEISGDYYVLASNWREAVRLFRESYHKELYLIVEVSRCIDTVDWHKY